MPRDINPMPALSTLRRRATEELLEKNGLIVEHFDVLPGDHDDAVNRVRLVVRQKVVDPDVVEAEQAFNEVVSNSPAPFAPPADDRRADEAREKLSDLGERLRRNKGIL